MCDLKKKLIRLIAMALEEPEIEELANRQFDWNEIVQKAIDESWKYIPKHVSYDELKDASDKLAKGVFENDVRNALIMVHDEKNGFWAGIKIHERKVDEIVELIADGLKMVGDLDTWIYKAQIKCGK